MTIIIVKKDKYKQALIEINDILCNPLDQYDDLDNIKKILDVTLQ